MEVRWKTRRLVALADRNYLDDQIFGASTHLRNRRLSAGQTLRQTAAHMGILREVYDRWERDETEPPVGFWKRIITFLGSYPMPQNSRGTAELVLLVRRVQDISQYEVGIKLGVIAKTVRLWEHGLIASPAIYHPRRPRASPLWQLVRLAWDDLLSASEKNSARPGALSGPNPSPPLHLPPLR